MLHLHQLYTYTAKYTLCKRVDSLIRIHFEESTLSLNKWLVASRLTVSARWMGFCYFGILAPTRFTP